MPEVRWLKLMDGIMVTTPVFLSNSNEDMRSYDDTLCDIVSFTGNIARSAKRRYLCYT